MSGLFVISCSSHDDNEGNDNAPVAIALSSKVDVITRSSLQNTQIANGQKVGFFVTKTSLPTDVRYTNVELTADGSGNFSSSPMYYPISTENVDFYAYHPYQASVSLAAPVTFSVQANQSTDASYLNSDLLYTTKTNVAKSTSAVPLTFKHKLTQLNFTIKQGIGMDLSSMTSVEVLGLLPTTKLNLADGSITAAEGVATDIKVHGVRGTTTGEDQVSGMSAIVVPQTAALNVRLFKVTVNGVSYYYKPSVDITYEAGKKYNYILTIDHAGITVTSDIEDWGDGGSINGTGSLD